jgi:murein DD-endopeptidase MepM/ murein hydrolase activator NlpD
MIKKTNLLFFSLILGAFLGCSTKKDWDRNRPPEIIILATSPFITKGGSAVVVFQVRDENIKSVFIQNYEKEVFFPKIIYGKNIYASTLAWPLYEKKFFAKIIASNQFGFSSTNVILLPNKKVHYPSTKIKIGGNFNSEKMKELGAEATNAFKNELEKYDFLMKSFQGEKEFNISTAAAKPPDKNFQFFPAQPFQPLSNPRISSPYGEQRIFTLRRKAVRYSYHLGLDLVETKNAPIVASNPGEVIYSGYNGANGNMILIHHSLGICSLYAHCSEFFVRKGEMVKAGQIIAKSGTTGYSLGDHLHFSMIVQGRYVNPLEWMDSKWLSENFNSVISNALSKIK